MLRIDRVLGSRLEPELSEALHRLEHRGAIDVVQVPVADLARRRLPDYDAGRRGTGNRATAPGKTVRRRGAAA